MLFLIYNLPLLLFTNSQVADYEINSLYIEIVETIAQLRATC